jgi:NDP-sugar pyrophosphorylase family protein
MKGMILAAGFGTRFRPVTYTLPKPMVPLCNRPLIAYAVESMLSAGVDELIINLHHLPRPIEEYLRQEFADRCRFRFSLEAEILGTGGGIRKVRPFLEGSEDFLVANADTVQIPPFRALVAARRRVDALAALTLRHPPAGDRFTRVYFDQGRIDGIGEGKGQALMFSGSHVISSRIFRYLPERDFSGLTEDVYIPLLRDRRETIAAVVDDGIWFDIGTPLRYFTASLEVAALMISGRFPLPPGSRVDGPASTIVAEGTTLGGASLVNCCVIGSGTTVRSGASLDRTIVWNDAVIPSGAILRDSVVAHGVNLPPDVRLENVLVSANGPDIPGDFDGIRFGDLVATAIDPSRPAVAVLANH